MSTSCLTVLFGDNQLQNKNGVNPFKALVKQFQKLQQFTMLCQIAEVYALV